MLAAGSREFTQDIIVNSRLWFARAASFNAAFDSLPSFSLASTLEELEAYLRGVVANAGQVLEAVERARIDIGPCAEVLRSVAFGIAPIPDTIDLAMFRVIELDGDVYYYRAPMSDRKEGVNVVQLSVGGFLFFLKIDKRRPGSLLPLDCWLRGQQSGSFLPVPGVFVEEARMHRELAGQPAVRHVFGTM